MKDSRVKKLKARFPELKTSVFEDFEDKKYSKKGRKKKEKWERHYREKQSQDFNSATRVNATITFVSHSSKKVYKEFI